MRKGFLLKVAISLGISILLSVGMLTGLVVLDEWFSTPMDCPSPCKDPGIAEDIPTCQAAEFKLELYKTTVPKGKSHSLWYKAVLKNISCVSFAGLLANDLIEGPEFKIWDPSGSIVEPSRSEYDGIIPYSFDREVLQVLSRDASRNISESWSSIMFWRLDLGPGESFSVLPSAAIPSLIWLQPHTISRPLDYSVFNEAFRPIIEEKLRGKQIPEPPSGYTAPRNNYIFQEPGKYRVRAIFRGNYEKKRLYPGRDNFRAYVLFPILSVVDWLLGSSFAPRIKPLVVDFPYYGNRLHVESNIVEFEVKP